MANNQDYQSKLELLKSIPDAATVEPGFPVGSYLQESENLYHWALTDLEKFLTIGITKKMLDDLPVRAGACREAQSIWMKDYRSQQDAQLQWDEQAPLAYEMRDALLHTMRYAFRNDAALMGRVRSISDGGGHADMIQDLNDLTVLGRENLTLLQTMGVDEAKLNEASTLSDEMATLLAKANGDRAEQNQSKMIRDKAYTHLKELTDEIYAAGKFLFWKDNARNKGYTSSYWRKTKSSKKKGEPETNVNTTD